MSKDDMEVIMYKVLKYLYESLKAGHKTCLEEVAWKCKLFDITREYWLLIMRELIDSGYVSGIKYVEAKDMEGVIDWHVLHYESGAVIFTVKQPGAKNNSDAWRCI